MSNGACSSRRLCSQPVAPVRVRSTSTRTPSKWHFAHCSSPPQYKAQPSMGSLEMPYPHTFTNNIGLTVEHARWNGSETVIHADTGPPVPRTSKRHPYYCHGRFPVGGEILMNSCGLGCVDGIHEESMARWMIPKLHLIASSVEECL